jgi:hypothetical protein
MLLVLSLVAMIFADFYVHAAHACRADRHNDISAHDAIDRTGFSYGTIVLKPTLVKNASRAREAASALML